MLLLVYSVGIRKNGPNQATWRAGEIVDVDIFVDIDQVSGMN